MPALNLNMTIPLGNAGHIHLTIDVHDIDQLTPRQRATIADTGREFYEFASATLITHQAADEASDDRNLREHTEATPATVHNTDGDVLRGVTGSRHQ